MNWDVGSSTMRPRHWVDSSSLIVGQTAEVGGGNGDGEEQGVGEAGAGGEDIEGDEGGFFEAGEDEPGDSGQVHRDESGGE